MKEQQVKMWNKYKWAPTTMLQNQTFNRWKNYIIKNDKMNYMENGEIKIDKEKFNYFAKSPLSRCHETMREIYLNKRLMIEKMFSVVKPPPTYSTPFPTY